MQFLPVAVSIIIMLPLIRLHREIIKKQTHFAACYGGGIAARIHKVVAVGKRAPVGCRDKGHLPACEPSCSR